MELVDGFVGDVTIAIPWSSLMESNITVEIKNLEMTVSRFLVFFQLDMVIDGHAIDIRVAG